jgi:endo-1,4-beta-D-glucanase Y
MRSYAPLLAVAGTIIAVTLAGGPAAGAARPAVPGPVRAHYVAGTIRPSAPQASQDAQVLRYYNEWKSAFVRKACGNGWQQIYAPDADHPYVAEGQGYGLVISALMASADPGAHAQFDGILKFVLAHPSVHNKDLMAAEQNTACKSVNGSDSATDGDMDIAYGLLLADKLWGSAGAYDYKALAVKHINAIKQSELNPRTNLLLLGDWSAPDDAKLYYASRSSDWMADHFRAFRRATGDAAWDTILTAHQNAVRKLVTDFAPNTGLLPDFVQDTNTAIKPAKGNILESPHDGDYDYNACRDPWRVGVDAITGGDAVSVDTAKKLTAWIKGATGGNPAKVGNGYKLSGSKYGNDNDTAFWTPFAVAAMADPASKPWLDALWAKMAAGSVDRGTYYGASIQLQVMIVVSGGYLTP